MSFELISPTYMFKGLSSALKCFFFKKKHESQVSSDVKMSALGSEGSKIDTAGETGLDTFLFSIF